MIEWKIKKKKKIVKILIIKDWRKVGGIPNKDISQGEIALGNLL